jgi:hypothetical protein
MRIVHFLHHDQVLNDNLGASDVVQRQAFECLRVDALEELVVDQLGVRLENASLQLRLGASDRPTKHDFKTERETIGQEELRHCHRRRRRQ